MDSAQQILDFWFGRPGELGSGEHRAAWFRKDPEFDAAIRERFGATWERALKGDFADWLEQAESCLAYIVLTDQFPRNMFRASARAFATDPLALHAARQALALGFDRELPAQRRMFIYLPFEHSEDLADQRLAVDLCTRLDQESGGDLARWARRHHDIIARFGRFPHRNALLGRESSAEEIEFLRQPGSSF